MNPKRVSTSIVVLASVLFVVGASAAVANEEAVEAGKKAAAAWLGLVDTEQGGESWDEAGSLFKSQVSKDRWVGMLDQVRGPLGAVQSRELASATFAKTLPNAPDGQYVTVVYDTSFKTRPSAKETVALFLDEDGELRVIGYFIE